MYFQDFVSKQYKHDSESILTLLLHNKIDVYSLLDDFIGFMQTKNFSPSTINQYLAGVRSYMGYYDIDIVLSKFKRRVRMKIGLISDTLFFSLMLLYREGCNYCVPIIAILQITDLNQMEFSLPPSISSQDWMAAST